MASIVHFLTQPKLMSGFANIIDSVRRMGAHYLAEIGFNEAELAELGQVTFAESIRCR